MDKELHHHYHIPESDTGSIGQTVSPEVVTSVVDGGRFQGVR
jgi:hypothetical protein